MTGYVKHPQLLFSFVVFCSVYALESWCRTRTK